MDFSRVQGDHIDRAAIDANTAAAGNPAFAFIGSALHHKIAGELRFVVAGGVTISWERLDGDGTSKFPHRPHRRRRAAGPAIFVL